MSIVENGVILTVDVVYTESAIQSILQIASELDPMGEFTGNMTDLSPEELRGYTAEALRIVFVDPDGPRRLMEVPAVHGWTVDIETR